MKNTKNSKLSIPTLNNFGLDIHYTEAPYRGEIERFELHTHSEIEFYINIAGDISFLVNNKLYPAGFGDVIISRPGEYHHCVCHSPKDHNYFCVWLQCEQNPFIKEFFTETVKSNLVSPTKAQKEELIEFFFRLMKDDIDNQEKFFCFFNILNILKSAEGMEVKQQDMPRELAKALKYIDENISKNIKVSDISRDLYISESTVERRFKEYLNIKPLEFIRKRKMIIAAELLRKGESVLNTGIAVGYSDNSYFIKVFSRYYGMTPYRYKKKYFV